MMTKASRLTTVLSLSLLMVAAVSAPPLHAQTNMLTNDSIANMVKDKVTSDVIITMIHAADPERTAFEISTAAVLTLKAAGVPDDVIQAMEEQVVRQDEARGLTNQAIIDLVKAKVDTAIIVTRILRADLAKTKFELAPGKISELTLAKVPPEVIQQMRLKKQSVIDPDQDPPVLAALGARITGGVIMANGPVAVTPATNTAPASVHSPQFSEASTYLAFEAQPVWVVEEDSKRRRGKRFGGEGLVSVRATSIPVAGVTQVTAPTGEFLQSQKAVQFQFGGVLDYHFRDFSMFSSQFHWALGGGVSWWLQSVTDAQRGVRIWNLQDDLFDAWTIHIARASLFQRQSVGNAKRWRPAAYIDISRGKFQNFETASAKEGVATVAQARQCLATPSACYVNPLPTDAYDITKSCRTYVELRLLLSYIYFGADINNGHGRDDARFIGGVTVTLDRFFAR